MAEILYVSDKQYNILSIVAGKAGAGIDIDELATLVGARREDLMRDVSELVAKGLITEERIRKIAYHLTQEAQRYLEKGFPEERAIIVAEKCLGKTVDEFVKCLVGTGLLEEAEAKIALQNLVKNKCIFIEKGTVSRLDEAGCDRVKNEAARLRNILETIAKREEIGLAEIQLVKKRKLVYDYERTVVKLYPTERLQNLMSLGRILRKEIVTVVKPAYVRELERYVIKEFDLSVEPPSPPISRKHPFMEFIEELRRIMVAMGFEEVKGPHVELEFWNFDALFQAQDHPAREIHDTFFIEGSYNTSVPLDVLMRAKAIHEEGWGYKWDQTRAMRLVLRSQTTAVSARAIHSRGSGEYRVFTIDRNFRPENLDPKHSMEFYQLDGVIVGRDVSFKHLLYFFKELAAALGIKEVWFKPGYFPFTEPSVEGYIKHPKLGWIEVFPGGVFRPEVMKILGAPDVRAVAWGIGVDRLAMTVLEVDDIRLLFAKDIEKLSSMKNRGLEFFYYATSGRDVVVRRVPS